MKFVLTKKWKIIICVLAFLLAVIIVLASVLPNVQYAKENYALFGEARSILLKNFDSVDLGGTKSPKRVIDNENPMNLVNYYGDESILDLWKSIPDNQKPYTIILLVPGQILLPNSETALRNLEKWADTCEQNSIPYCIQNINGETHMEARPPIKYLEERFASKHKYFYGLNAAELYNGVEWRGKAESDNSLYIIDMIKLCAKYGAYFIWTDTNLNYKNGMILEWFENNESFYTTFKEYSRYICMLNKESIADPATYGLLEGLWLAGLIGNWGIASDWWHWQINGYKSLFGENDKYVGNEWEQIFSYPENMYVQSMMLGMSRGATCFKQEAPNFSISYGGNSIAGFEYAISPLLDRVINGKIKIPTKEEVLSETSFAFVGRENYMLSNYNFGESNLYPKQGAGGIVPLLPKNIRKTEREYFESRGIVLVNYRASNFMEKYGKNDADTYLTRTGQNWYYINNLENKKGSKYAKFEPLFASSSSFYIQSGEHSSAIITDTKDGFDIYLSNYRTDKTNLIQADSKNIAEAGGWAKYLSNYLTLDSNGNPKGVDDTALRTTIIEITGSYKGGEPLLEFNNSELGNDKNGRKYNVTKTYNKDTKVLKLVIEHNGIVDFKVTLDDSGKEYKSTRREAVEDIYKEVDADKTALVEATLEKIVDRHNYTYFSYLEYDKQFEKAKVMISENIYTQKQIDKQVKQLKEAKDNLINISNEVSSLRSVNSNYQASAWSAYDNLIRELLSCQTYVSGRSNSLKYASIYRNKSIVNTFSGKRKAINKAHNNLREYL